MAKKKKLFQLPKLNFTNKRQGFAVVLIGIVVALILGTFNINSWTTGWAYWILAIGVFVGVLNIFHKEGLLFLISALTLVFMLNLLAGLAFFPNWAVTLFNAVIYLLAPASIMVGLKILYSLAVSTFK